LVERADREGDERLVRGTRGVDDLWIRRASWFSTRVARDDFLRWLRRQVPDADWREGRTHRITLLTDWSQVETYILRRRETLLEQLSGRERRGWREMLINKRDAPLLLRTPTCAVDPPSAPPGMMPVFSQYTSEAYDDRCLPTLVDYRAALGGGVYLPNARDIPAPSTGVAPPEWRTRRATAVFRGAATGWGVDVDSNVRLRAVQLCYRWRREGTNVAGGSPATDDEYLDAELTSWNGRVKCPKGDGVVRVVKPLDFDFNADAMNFVPMERQAASFKYALFLDGHVGADRMGALARHGFVVLIPESNAPQVEIVSHLREWVHFVPIKSSLLDLKEKIDWLRAHDEDAAAMARALTTKYQELYHRAGTIERRFGRALRRTEPPSDDRAVAERSVRFAFDHFRAAVYVLVDGQGRIRTIAPFANASFCNSWGASVRAPPGESVADVLRGAQEFDRASMLSNVDSWWTNGRLVCNVLPRGVWGEALLDLVHILLERSARAAVSDAVPESLDIASAPPQFPDAMRRNARIASDNCGRAANGRASAWGARRSAPLVHRGAAGARSEADGAGQFSSL